jgi:hypothetical protein
MPQNVAIYFNYNVLLLPTSLPNLSIESIYVSIPTDRACETFVAHNTHFR